MTSWQRYCSRIIRYEDLGISLDYSLMDYDAKFFPSMSGRIKAAVAGMKRVEAGKLENPDEGRMVGHYWLRTPSLAPAKFQAGIKADIAAAKSFAKAIHTGKIRPQRGGKFTRLLVIGIGGSALGPQLVADALVNNWSAPLRTHFFDNTDPDGIHRVLSEIGTDLARTLVVVISKSGGTAETRNGMLEARAAYEAQQLNFSKHAVAVTGTKANHIESKLEKVATENKWLKIFPMTDWVGGRTSIMSTVGLVPAALQGVDVDQFLAGARAMDAKTRTLPAAQNLSLMLALMWHHAGGGKGAKDMVILPYKDRLVLLSKYLQQLVMESLGKEHDLKGVKVDQGIAVYGNKGSTDQHAYVQQLRDGVPNFFATFLEVREAGGAPEPLKVEADFTSGDFLQGYLRGTRAALYGKGRESMTLSLPRLDAFNLGAIIAAYERAVGFYAYLVGINAYHQPGVEAGKKAAGEFLSLMAKVKGALGAKPHTAEEIAALLQADPEAVFHALTHLSANGGAKRRGGKSPAEDRFSK